MSSKPIVPFALEHFVRLNQSVWYHEPALSSITTSPLGSASPDLIIIAGWMDASPRNLAKYTAGYEKLYPPARILAITTTTFDAAFLTHFSNLYRVKAVTDIISALPPGAKLLVHCFSVGGAWTTCLVAKTYREQMGRPLPVTAMVLDSTPGRARYGTTIRSFSVALPKNIILNMIGGLVIRFMYGVYIFSYWVSGKLDLISQVREDLNNKELFDAEAPRIYIYSEADVMVQWEFVEEHMEEAKSLGYTIEGDKFIESPHCGHLLVDFERYWARITELWGTVS